jgi:hypothetical protein
MIYAFAIFKRILLGSEKNKKNKKLFYQKLQIFLKLKNVNSYKQLQRKGEKQLPQKKV